MNLLNALDVVANTEPGKDDAHDALHALREGVNRLQDIERAALGVALSAQVDPPAMRYLVPAHPFDVLRRRLEPIHRATPQREPEAWEQRCENCGAHFEHRPGVPAMYCPACAQLADQVCAHTTLDESRACPKRHAG